MQTSSNVYVPVSLTHFLEHSCTMDYEIVKTGFSKVHYVNTCKPKACNLSHVVSLANLQLPHAL